MFTEHPTYDPLRTLEVKTPYLKGEDVFALQMALNFSEFPCGTPDGVLGPMTDRAIRECQRVRLLTVDGKAGGLTQKALALIIATIMSQETKTLYAALMGQIEHESGYRLGNYTPLYPNGSFDAGATQRNSKIHPIKEAFDPVDSIRELGVHTRTHFDLFVGIKQQRRRWSLAQGAWNRPAYACWIAREEGATKVTRGMTAEPTDIQQATLEAYMQKVSKYLPHTL